jgi:hypothetical protein
MQILPVINPELKTTCFFPETSNINTANVKKAFLGKCFEMIEKVSVAYEKECYFISDIEHEFCNDLNFFIFYSSFDSISKGMKRYHIGVYSYLFFDLYYYDSNATDFKHFFTIEDVKKRFKNYCGGLKELSDKL